MGGHETTRGFQISGIQTANLDIGLATLAFHFAFEPIRGCRRGLDIYLFRTAIANVDVFFTM